MVAGLVMCVVERMLGTDPECKDELVEADRSAVVLVEAWKQLVQFGFRHVESVILDAVLQFIVVQHSTAVVVIDSKRSAQVKEIK